MRWERLRLEWREVRGAEDEREIEGLRIRGVDRGREYISSCIDDEPAFGARVVGGEGGLGGAGATNRVASCEILPENVLTFPGPVIAIRPFPSAPVAVSLGLLPFDFCLLWTANLSNDFPFPLSFSLFTMVLARDSSSSLSSLWRCIRLRPLVGADGPILESPSSLIRFFPASILCKRAVSRPSIVVLRLLVVGSRRVAPTPNLRPDIVSVNNVHTKR